MTKISLLLFALAGGLLFFSLFGAEGYWSVTALEDQLHLQSASTSRLEEKVVGLRREVHKLQNDPRHIEKVARNELGVARSDERVFVFND